MKIVTFRGKTPSEALKKARLELGDNGILLETKEVHKGTLYEVVIGIEEYKTDTENINIQTDVDNSKELKEIKSEMIKLTDKIKFIQDMVWDEKVSELEYLIPPEFAEMYRIISQSGMDIKHISNIMSITLKYMPINIRRNPSLVTRYFQTLLKKMVLIKKEESLKVNMKKVLMLVGPTGVGKTTSIAKLAARYSFLIENRCKVGLVVIDTYRIGAVEQLTQYARIMKLEIKTVVDISEFSSALNSLKYCDYILIDTMGSSPYDQNKIEKIYECLEVSETEYTTDVALVMSSSMKEEDLRITYEKFSTLNIDSIIFTKLDETRGFGNIFSFVYESKKPISYFSIGQEVPEDLVCASGDFLVNCLLNGFDRDKA